jgi:hypothetical protein
MKNNKMNICKTALCLIMFLFVVNAGMAQQNGNNVSSAFSNGTIISSENATTRAELRMANKTYDENMVGVYNNNAENSPVFKANPVTSAGITYVKYNSENGAIKKGDLITSSSESGVGMKATQSGIVLGITLEDATASSGLIKIRVLIQYVKQ